MRRWGLGLAAALLAAVPASGWAEDYWYYTYKYLDVVAAGTSQYAINLAHNVDRLDRTLRKVLPLVDPKPVPTHVYALAEGELRRFGIGDNQSRYQTNGSETFVVTSTYKAPAQYWGAYFGYTGGVVATGGGTRYPTWFSIGAPSVFAETEFRGDRIQTGGLTYYFGHEINRGGRLMPMSTFLTMRQADVDRLSPADRRMYDAEAWYVAREFLVEGHYRSELTQYLTAMAGGTAEPEAFSSSFKVSHEQLDKFLMQVMFDQAHFYVLDVPDDRDAGLAPPQKLTDAELKERLDALEARVGAFH